MFVLKTSKQFLPTERIVRREEYLLLQSADTLLDEAKNKRDKLLAQADRQIQLMMESTQTECEKLKQTSKEEAEQQRNQKQLEMIFSMLNHGIDYFETLEQTFIEVLKGLFLTILGEYPREERMYVLVKKAIKMLPDGQFLQISVRPEQAVLLKTKMGELKAAQPNLERIEIVADPTLKMDVCTLETETGILDASVSVQLETLLQAIKTSLA